MTEPKKPSAYLVHCEPCGGTGLRLNREGKFEKCAECAGEGRRVVHPYGAGEQTPIGEVEP